MMKEEIVTKNHDVQGNNGNTYIIQPNIGQGCQNQQGISLYSSATSFISDEHRKKTPPKCLQSECAPCYPLSFQRRQNFDYDGARFIVIQKGQIVLKRIRNDITVSLTGSDTGAKSILILTYMRSGSSLTGDILQQANGAFYIYEPLRSLFKDVDEGKTVIYINGSRRRGHLDRQTEIQETMYNWFTCDIQKTTSRTIYDIFMRYGKKSRQVEGCLLRYRYSHYKVRNQMCAEEMRTACLRSPLRIIKTIRTELEWTERLLDDLPNLKVIHLVRDPRATMYSRMRFSGCMKVSEKPWCIKKYCDKLTHDVMVKDRLIKKYPDRIKIFFYDDIASRPLEASQKLYDFIGEELTGSIRDYIYKITSAGTADDCVNCSIRSNSTEHVSAWRKEMNETLINLVQKHCKYVLNLYSYDFV